LSHSNTNKVDVQDYNDQVIRYITIPNILLNTVLTVQEPSSNITTDEVKEDEESSEEEDSENEEDDEEEKRIEEDADTCDAEAEISTEKIPTMLKMVSERTRAFVGDWSTLPVSAFFI
jgi:protein-histidine N-methyltransferase